MAVKHWKWDFFEIWAKLANKRGKRHTCKPGDILLLIRDPDHRTVGVLHLDPPPLKQRVSQYLVIMSKRVVWTKK